MKKLVMASIGGGVILFFWGFISWTVLSWHKDTSLSFDNEAAVAQSIVQNAPQAGIYFLPFNEKDFVDGGPSVFAAIAPQYHLDMGSTLSIGLLGYIVSALLVCLALNMCRGLNYAQRLKFVLLLGLIIGLVGHFPYWNWMNFSTPYTLVMILDSVLGWLLAGLLIAKLVGVQDTDPAP